MNTVSDVQRAAARKDFWPTVFAAFAIAASPNAATPLRADLPYRLQGSTLKPNPDAIKRWKAVMPPNMIFDHRNELNTLSGIGIDFGYEDDFTHIPDTSEQFGRALMSQGIPISVEGYHGDHNNQVPARVESRVVPFIADHLSFTQ